MKTFKQLKESFIEEKTVTSGNSVIAVSKSGKEFKVTIDGEHLDNYASEKEAISMAKEFIKQFKKDKL